MKTSGSPQVLGRWGQGGGQDLRPPRAADGLRAATAGPVSQLGGESLARIAPAPGDHGRARHPKSLGDLAVGGPSAASSRILARWTSAAGAWVALDH